MGTETEVDVMVVDALGSGGGGKLDTIPATTVEPLADQGGGGGGGGGGRILLV